jgi:formylglycine-generating enzyme required for sulfatase activity
MTGNHPSWATAVGKDQFGSWAELTVETGDGTRIAQRLRWIAPGRFRMGSPERETGRSEDEGPQHEVRIVQGFWLFNSPCTQPMWVAVMGDNPSYFRRPPVKCISWSHVQKFVAPIEDRVDALGLSSRPSNVNASLFFHRHLIPR